MEGTSATFIVDMTGEKRIRVQALLDTLERNNINPEGIALPRALDNFRRFENVGGTQGSWSCRQWC